MIERIQQIQARIREIHALLGVGPPPNESFGSVLDRTLTSETGVSAEVPPGIGNFFRPPALGRAAYLNWQPSQPRVRQASYQETPEHLRPLIHEAAAKYNLDPDLLAAVMQTESGFRPGAISSAGAQGLMQLMPGTARGLGVRDPFDPRQNVDAGARYLKSQITRFGSLEKGLAAYNAGPGNVRKHGGIPPFSETQNYVRRVLELYGQNRVRNGSLAKDGVARPDASSGLGR